MTDRTPTDGLELEESITEQTQRPEIAPESHHAMGVMQFFSYAHLPQHLQEVSAPFSNVAWHIVATLPENRQRELALEKLIEAKDCAVRARLCK
jgi:hypothetical protein